MSSIRQWNEIAEKNNGKYQNKYQIIRRKQMGTFFQVLKYSNQTPEVVLIVLT